MKIQNLLKQAQKYFWYCLLAIGVGMITSSLLNLYIATSPDRMPASIYDNIFFTTLGAMLLTFALLVIRKN